MHSNIEFINGIEFNCNVGVIKGLVEIHLFAKVDNQIIGSELGLICRDIEKALGTFQGRLLPYFRIESYEMLDEILDEIYCFNNRFKNEILESRNSLFET